MKKERAGWKGLNWRSQFREAPVFPVGKWRYQSTRFARLLGESQRNREIPEYFLFRGRWRADKKRGESVESRLTRKIGATKYGQTQIENTRGSRNIFECFGIWFDLSLGISGVTRKNEVPLLASRKRMQNPQTACCPEWWMKRYSGNGIGRKERLVAAVRITEDGS